MHRCNGKEKMSWEEFAIYTVGIGFMAFIITVMAAIITTIMFICRCISYLINKIYERISHGK